MVGTIGSGTVWGHGVRWCHASAPVFRSARPLFGAAFVPEHRFLGAEEAFDVAVRFRREHPYRLRLISTILGWGDLGTDDRLRAFLGSHPFVAFRPAR